MAREVILDAFIEKAEVHREQAIDALERCRLIGVIPYYCSIVGIVVMGNKIHLE